MIDYTQFADMVGSQWKTSMKPFITDEAQMATFTKFIDAKVELNKAIYTATTDFFQKIGK